MNIRRWLPWLLIGIVGAGVFAAVALHRASLERQRDAFVAHWSVVFQENPNLDALRALGQYETPFIIEFENGDWVAAQSDCACTGAGFDATVFVDSRGAVHYQTNHHFCGGEGLESELTRLNAEGLAHFYTGLKGLGVELKVWEPQEPT